MLKNRLSIAKICFLTAYGYFVFCKGVRALQKLGEAAPALGVPRAGGLEQKGFQRKNFVRCEILPTGDFSKCIKFENTPPKCYSKIVPNTVSGVYIRAAGIHSLGEKMGSYRKAISGIEYIRFGLCHDTTLGSSTKRRTSSETKLRPASHR